MSVRRISLALILAAMSACVSTTAVDAPEDVEPNSSFLAVVTVVADESGTDECNIGVLIPLGWSADSVTYTGGSAPPGNMNFGTPQFGLEEPYPPSPEDHWLHFRSANTIQAQSGDGFEVTVRIHTDSSMGYENIAFLAFWGPEYPVYWNGDPCSTWVDVQELNLEQSTWGSLKTLF